MSSLLILLLTTLNIIRTATTTNGVGNGPRGLHGKIMMPPIVLAQLTPAHQDQLYLTCSKNYGSYFYIQEPMPFLSASLACQSQGALLASIIPNNQVSLLNLYTWCSIATPSSLYPWVFGNAVAGNCPIITSNPTDAFDLTTTVACDVGRGALCQRVSEVIASFSTSTTFTTSQVTVSATLSLTSTTISTQINTVTASTTLLSTITVTSTLSTTFSTTSTVIVVTGTSSTTGVFPSPTTSTVSIDSVADTQTTSVTGILVTVTTVTKSTTTYSNSPVLTQILCPFLLNPLQTDAETI